MQTPKDPKTVCTLVCTQFDKRTASENQAQFPSVKVSENVCVHT